MATPRVNETATALMDALAASRREFVDKVPKGWRTAREISERHGIPQSTIAHKIADLKSKGKIECRKYRVMTGRGLYPTPHYYDP